MTAPSGEASAPRHDYRPEIDGLRAFAILAVIINHVDRRILPSGYLGVDIFFVISGYVITRSLQGRSAPTAVDFLLDFYGRRVRRLVPALVLCITITALFTVAVNPEPGKALDTGIWALFGLANLSLHNQATDYFALAADLNPFTHTWSLGVEEQFYLLFPWFAWFTGFSRQLRHGPLRLAWLMGLLCLASLICGVVLSLRASPGAYYLLSVRFWELGAGVLLALPLHRRWPVPWRSLLARPSLWLLALTATLFAPRSHALGATLAAVLFTTLLLSALEQQGSRVRRWLSHPLPVYLGLISYSLYLWHWSVLVISRWTIGIHWWSLPFQLLAMVLLAMASYHWVERPLRHRPWSQWRWPTLAYALLAGLGGAGILLLAGGPLRSSLYLGSRERADHASFERATRAEGTTLSEARCGRFAPDTLSNCVLPPGQGDRPTLLLMGDSHAQHLFPLLGALHRDRGLGVAAFAPGGGVFPPPLESAAWERRHRESWQFFQSVVPRLRRGDLVLLSSRIGPLGAEGGEALERWAREVEQLARSLASKGLAVVVVLPLPSFEAPVDPYPIEACLPEWFRPDPPSSCALHLQRLRPEAQQESLQVRRVLEPVARRQANLHLFDPFEPFCPTQTVRCATTSHGRQWFRDDNHLSVDGSLRLLDPLVEFLQAHQVKIPNRIESRAKPRTPARASRDAEGGIGRKPRHREVRA